MEVPAPVHLPSANTLTAFNSSVQLKYFTGTSTQHQWNYHFAAVKTLLEGLLNF